MGVNALVAACVVFCIMGTAVALQCYHCGMYNDGVGSITPCLNETHMKLMDCPRRDTNYCIKYINEGSTVRDCVPKCTEKEDWGSMTFCCIEDGCNSAPTSHLPLPVLLICTVISALVMMH